MEMSEVRQVAGRPSYLSPTKGPDGAWASAGAHALRAALRAKSPQGVMGLLKGMDAIGMASVLRETGFSVLGAPVSRGRDAVFAQAKPALQAALRRGVDGWTLNGGERQARAPSTAVGQRASQPGQVAARSPQQLPPMSNGLVAEEIIQQILKAPVVRIVPLGDQPFQARASLQMIAAQALQKGVMGFGFDGIAGKFDVPASMSEVVELHRDAAGAFAVQSARSSLHEWASGAKLTSLSEWVPDSVQRLLHGSVSLRAAEVVVSGITSGSVGRHAGDIGTTGIAELLAAKGLDISAPTIEQRASEMNLQLKSPDRDRGQYFGEVVARDHRASLIKVNRNEALELPHSAVGGERPSVGEQLRVNFKAGALAVSKAARIGRGSPSL